MAFSYDPYKKGTKLIELEEEQKKILSSKPTDWNRETNFAPVQAALDAYKNRGKFSYDLNGDALYKQYKDQYVNQGKQAMMDAMGQASAMTGGYGNSYAQTVGQQTYQGYLQGLNDKIPELYQLAYDRYEQEGQDLLTRYGLAKEQYDTAYGEYTDSVNRWNADRTYITDAVNNERSYDYGQYSDAYNRAFNLFKQDQTDTIEALKAQMGGMIDPNNVHVDENGNVVGIEGYKIANPNKGQTSISVTSDGFKERTGDNFKINLNGNKYLVENDGKVEDKNIIASLDAMNAENGSCIINDGKLYYKNNNKYFLLRAVGAFGKKDYSKLFSEISNNM